MKRIFFVPFICLLALSACGDDKVEPETIKERLEKIEGRELTSTEVTKQLDKAEFICQLNNDVLVAMWETMDEKQLAFQDFVFEVQCKDKAALYTESTDRLLSEASE